ncbi:hypothetical protein [Jiella sonneratiae]|uniref:Uncharacterized protein n=1 Tax=Jiella sonneratiae TaxID=2816856 RepID=A0ABS3JAC8_9HYPH|nr:hypothetical protein [Jiella sonneratiae]MBO0906605.1 hypothetical protein [Jiella sonneratiae]
MPVNHSLAIKGIPAESEIVAVGITDMANSNGDNAKSLAITMEELQREISRDDLFSMIETDLVRRAKILADKIWEGCSLEAAEALVQVGVDFSFQSR